MVPFLAVAAKESNADVAALEGVEEVRAAVELFAVDLDEGRVAVQGHLHGELTGVVELFALGGGGAIGFEDSAFGATETGGEELVAEDHAAEFLRLLLLLAVAGAAALEEEDADDDDDGEDRAGGDQGDEVGGGKASGVAALFLDAGEHLAGEVGAG